MPEQMSGKEIESYEFGQFRLNVAERFLARSGGERVPLSEKPFETLCILVRNAGHLVNKNELLEQVWADSFVEENNLNKCIHAIRRALGEKPGERQFIETVKKHGFRFVAEVRRVPPEKTADAVDRENESQSKTNGNSSAEFSLLPKQIARQRSGAVVALADWQRKADEGAAEEFDFAAEREKSNDKNPKLELVSAKLDAAQFDKLPNAHFSKKITNRKFLFWLSAGVILIAGLAWAFFWRGESKPNILRQAKFTKLTASGKVSNVAITPDAKYAVFTQNEEGGESLWLRHLASGSQTQVLPAQAAECVGLAITPDGNFIYCSTFSKNKVINPLWRIPLLGGSVQEIPNVAADVSVSFSPDGKRIAFTENFSHLKEKHLKVADADGSNQITLLRAKAGERSLPVFKTSPVAWSLDGDAIACAIHSTDEKGSFAQIYLINPADGGEKLLSAQRWKRIGYVAWADGENLAVVGKEFDSAPDQIWLVSRKTGEVRRLTNDLNEYLWIAAANGNLLSLQKSTVSSLQTARFDEQTETLQPRQILSESGAINNLAVASDGAIFYGSRASGANEIWRVEPDGGGAKQLTTDAFMGYGLAISPVDAAIVFNSTRGGKGSLWLANSEGQNIRQLTDGNEDSMPNFTPDGKSVIYQRGYVNETPSIWRVSTSGEAPRKLYNETFAAQPTVSPDGAQTAFQFMDHQSGSPASWCIGLIESENGKFLRKLDLPKHITERRTRWHPSGAFLTQIFYDENGANFLLLPVDGNGESRTISEAGKGKVGAFAWLPDGKQIVYSLLTETADIVLLNDF